MNWLGAGASAGAGATGVFLAMRWLLEYFAGRLDRRENRLDEQTQKMFDRLSGEVDRLTDRVTVAERSLAECKAQHAASERRVAQLERQIEHARSEGWGATT